MAARKKKTKSSDDSDTSEKELTEEILPEGGLVDEVVVVSCHFPILVRLRSHPNVDELIVPQRRHRLPQLFPLELDAEHRHSKCDLFDNVIFYI